MIDVISLCEAEISLLVSTSELDDPVNAKGENVDKNNLNQFEKNGAFFRCLCWEN